MIHMMDATLAAQKDIVIKDNVLLIKDVSITEPEIIDYFKNQSQDALFEKFNTVLRTGILALKSTDISEKVDYVEKKFNELNHVISESLDDKLNKLDNTYDDNFGEDGAFNKLIDKNFGKDGLLLKDILDPNTEASPLYKLKSEINKAISDLRFDLGIKSTKEEVEKKGTKKGYYFESHCKDLLDKSAQVFGDVVEDLTKTSGDVSKSMKGDILVSIPESKQKIIFEVKDRYPSEKSTPFNTKEIKDILDKSIENRDASFGIFVVKYVEAISKDIGWFQEIGDNKLAVALESIDDEIPHEGLLLIAYKWARAKLNSQNNKEKTIDPEFIVNKIKLVAVDIKEIKRIKNDCDNIITYAEKIKKTTKTHTDNIDENIAQINKSLDNAHI